MNLIDRHLQDVTVDKLVEHKQEGFVSYCAIRGVQLGFNGLGQYIVKTKTEKFISNNPNVAVAKYKELVKQ